MLVLGAWFRTRADGDCGHYVDARSGVARRLVEVVPIYGAIDAWHSWVVLLGQKW